MSTETASSTSFVTIYVPLLNEGTSVVRPTRGVDLGGGTYRVLPTQDYDPDDEQWAFTPGSIVQCNNEIWSGREVLVARRLVQET
jgi:hypothetical protein